MPNKQRIVLFAGAPEQNALDWDDSELLPSFVAAFERFLHGRTASVRRTQEESLLFPGPAKWRAVAYQNEALLSQNLSQNDEHQTQFISFRDERHAEDEDVHTDFLEHSMAIMDGLDSSQILPCRPNNAAATDLGMTFMSNTSFASSSAGGSSFGAMDNSPYQTSPARMRSGSTAVNVTGPITNLKQVPTADYITRIQPQTMTIHVLVGVITVSPLRTVRLRRSDAEMDILELIVGDESRAGFTISFWLTPRESQSKSSDDLREYLQALRSGDVVLLQNIALSSFRNCVYGQSLSKRFAKNSTAVVSLDSDVSQAVPTELHAKLGRVRDWASDFVGISRKSTLHPESESTMLAHNVRELPPDTQD